MAMADGAVHPLGIVGAGSLGQAFAALLAHNDQRPTLLATPQTAAALRAAGHIRLRGVIALDVPVASVPAPGVVGLTDDPARLPAGAGVIFTTKGHQLPGAVAVVHAAWPAGDGAWVAGVQNGVVKDDVLTEAFGSAAVVGAATILGAERDADGTVTVTSFGKTFLGEFSGERSSRVTRVAEAFQAAGIPTEAVDDIRGVIWSKACNAAGVFGVSVLTRVTAPQVFGDPALMRAYLSLIRETAAIGAAAGATVGDYPGFPSIRTYVTRPDAETLAAIPAGSSPNRTGSLPSMTQDLLAGRPMEVAQIFGDLVTRAAALDVTAPRLTLVRDLLTGLDHLQNDGTTF